MPHHQRGLMRRKCWRCQQHNLVESDGDAVGVVCELPKKMGVDPNHPRHDALPPHQQGRQIHIDQGGSNRMSSKVQTTFAVKGHTQKKGGFPIPSPVDAFTPFERDVLIFPPDGPCRYP